MEGTVTRDPGSQKRLTSTSSRTGDVQKVSDWQNREPTTELRMCPETNQTIEGSELSEASSR